MTTASPTDRNERKPGFWGVKDMNAKYGETRAHAVTPTIVYELASSAFCWMPPEHAMIFTRDPAFVVIDDKDAEQVVLPKSELRKNDQRLDIGADECVANLAELKTEALLSRALLRAGADGPKFTVKTPREKLIDFLINDATGQESLKAEATRKVDADYVDVDEDPRAADEPAAPVRPARAPKRQTADELLAGA